MVLWECGDKLCGGDKLAVISGATSERKVGEIDNLPLFTRISAVTLSCEAAVDTMGLSLKMLGGFVLRDSGGVELSLPTRKVRALLSYLAVNADKPQPRERLMALLWSDRGERQARQSLNNALKSIRRLSNGTLPALLTSDGEQVALRGDLLESDVGRFHALLAEDPASAAALYDGPFLDGLSIPDPHFEEWLRATRAELQNLACSALAKASDAAAASADIDSAIEIAKRLLSLDPLSEEAHRRLMRLLYRSGNRAAALRQYQACAELLDKELQVAPDTMTQTLYEEIRRDKGLAKPTGPQSEQIGAPPSLPEKPSIAVLPFDNLSADPDQEFVADGIAEDIITELSRFHSLFVIARGSSFSFKGQSLDTQTIAAKLGVRYLLEGSIRTSGSRIRIAAQLVEAQTAKQIWAERYDRDLEDIFAVQDEVTTAIVLAIAPQIDRRERQRAQRRTTEHLDAWSQFQRGLTAYYLSTERGLRSAASLFDKATELDPNFATAYAYAAASRNRLILNFGAQDSDTLIAEVKERLDAALDLDPQDVVALFVTGVLESLRGNHNLAIDRVEQAIALNPNSAYSHGILGFVLRRAERPEDAIEAIDRALRLSPYDPATSMFLSNKTGALFEIGRYADCAECGRRAISVPGAHSGAHLTTAAALVLLGRHEEAREVLDNLKARFPNYSFAWNPRAVENSKSTIYQRRLEIVQNAGLAQ